MTTARQPEPTKTPRMQRMDALADLADAAKERGDAEEAERLNQQARYLAWKEMHLRSEIIAAKNRSIAAWQEIGMRWEVEQECSTLGGLIARYPELAPHMDSVELSSEQVFTLEAELWRKDGL